MTCSVPLPAIATADSANAVLPKFTETGLAKMLDLIVDAPSWPERWDVVSSFWHASHTSTFEVEATVRMLTAVGEQLGERSIECIEAASFYRLTLHTGWRMAAMRWFNAADADEIGAFIDANPGFTRFVGQHAGLYPPPESQS
jgi:hypothetical protein